MFGLNDGMRYYVCQRYVRMNLGINGLYRLVSQEMDLPPLSGAVFIFFSKNRRRSSFCAGTRTVSRCIRSGLKEEPSRSHISTPARRLA